MLDGGAAVGVAGDAKAAEEANVGLGGFGVVVEGGEVHGVDGHVCLLLDGGAVLFWRILGLFLSVWISSRRLMDFWL